MMMMLVVVVVGSTKSTRSSYKPRLELWLVPVLALVVVLLAVTLAVEVAQ